MGNFFRSLFGSKKSPAKFKTRMQSRRLELIGLEERVTPAVVSNATGIVTITLGVGESITNLNAEYNGSNQLVINTIGVSNTGSVSGVTYSSSANGVDDIITVDDATFAGGILGLSVVGNIGTESVTVGSDINLVTNNNFPSNSLSIATNLEAINVNAAITAKAGTSTTGAVTLAATAVGIGSTINTTAGNISITGATTLTAATTLTTTGGAVAITGAVNGAFGLSTVSGSGAATITGIVGGTTPVAALSINSTGLIGLTAAVNAASVTTVGTGAVTLGGTVTTTGATNFAGAVTGTTSVNVVAGTTATFGSTVNTPGAILVTGAGDITFTSTVGNSGAASVNAKSTAGDVIFNNTVTTTQVGGFISEATSATKATKIANAVTVGAGANALVTGNLIANNSTSAAITTSGVGNITITGNVDASVANNNLTLSAATGAITIGGNVGSSSTAMGDLTADGSGIFLASGTVVANDIKIGQITRFATSVTFAKAVVTTGANKIIVDTSNAGTITFSESITSTNATGVIDLQTVNGNLTVIGAINTKHQVEIASAAGVVVLSGNITNDGTTITGAQAGVFIEVGSGSLTTSGTITAVGNNAGGGGIHIQSTLSNSSVTINGALSTTGGGAIRLQAGNGSGINQMSVNAPVTTSGATAGEIIVYANGGSVTLNQPVTLGTAGKIILSTGLSTDTITINSGAAISAGTDIYDTDFVARGYLSAGKINLAANLTTTLGKINLEPVGGITLSGPVSMKAQGTTVGDIILGRINGAQNLTLEATDQISLGTVGQTTPLNTFTVTNSRGASVTGNFTAGNVVLSDTTGSIFFKGNTTITSSLSTAAKAYNIEFGDSLSDTTVLAGVPVFSNTGNLRFFGTTSFPSGATITGGSLANVNLAGTIVSGGPFNIGAGLSNINISDNTQLILNSTTSGSTFASPLNLNAGGAGSFNLLGVGMLTLSANSTAGVTTGDTINVINGTLNVTGKIGGTTFATNGKITGAGGTIDHLTVNTGTVAPGGTLNTGVVTFNAATTYIADVLTTTTASNLTGNAGFSLGGATLSLSSVASGLAVNNTFTIIDNTATASVPIVGTFVNQPEGSSISAIDASGNTVVFTISYIGGTNTNDVTLTVASVTPQTPTPAATPQPMVAGQPALNKFTAVGADAGGGPLVTITFQNGTYVSFFAYASTFTGGVRVALGDVNGDGSTDVITGAGPGGGPQVNVYNVNNATGAVSLQKSFFAFSAPSFTGGVYVAAGHTNGDDFADVIVGAGATGGSRVQVYAGSATGLVTTSTLNDFFAYSPAFTGGVVVAAGQRDAVAGEEVITAPASNGGYNIKSFDVNGNGNSPTLVDNFFAFNDTTSVGGLSLAVGFFDSSNIADLIVGTTNSAFGVFLDSDTSGIATVPFAGFTGAIRAGVAEDSFGQEYAVALAGPTGGPRVSVFSVGATSLTETDNLFVMNPAFTGGLFASS